MSRITVREPTSTNRGGAIEMEIRAREHVGDGSVIRRLLPAPGCPMLGPYVSFDHINSTHPLLPPGAALDINSTTDVATVSYCFEGVSGPAANHQSTSPSFQSIQCCIALPDEFEFPRPVAEQYAAGEMPEIVIADTTVRVILGEAYGRSSPAAHYVPILQLHCSLPEDGEYQLPTTLTARSVYVVDGLVAIDGHGYTPGMMAIAASGWPVRLYAQSSSVVMVIGGEPPRLVRKAHKWAWS